MGLEAIGPKLDTSKPEPDHKAYQYLFRSLTVTHRNHVWEAAITGVPMAVSA
jgi:putative transposase